MKKTICRFEHTESDVTFEQLTSLLGKRYTDIIGARLRSGDNDYDEASLWTFSFRFERHIPHKEIS